MSASPFAGFSAFARSSERDLARDEPHWYACYTRGRHEKRVEALLRERGIESYLPVFRARRRWKDRIKVVDWPLFPSYVFGRFAPGELARALGTHGVSGVVRVGDRPVPIPQDDIDNVRRFAAALGNAGAEPQPEPFVGVGQRVRVGEGPFAGVEGEVVEIRGRRRVLVGVRGIGQGFAVDVDARCLQPLPDAVRSSAA